MSRPVVASSLLALALGFAGPLASPASASDEPALTPWVQQMLCAPRAGFDADTAVGRVTGAYFGTMQSMFGPGERVVLRPEGGTTFAAGQYLLAQRSPRSQVYADTDRWLDSATQRAGILRVDSVAGGQAVATVVWACDGVETGDVLEAYASPGASPPSEAAAGTPDFEVSGSVLSGSQDRRMGAENDMLLVTRREGQSPAPGQRVTFFRRAAGADGPVTVLGHGLVQAADDTTFTVLVVDSLDAIYVDDRVSLHR